MIRRRYIVAALALIPAFVAAQQFGIPRRIFDLVVVNDLTVNGSFDATVDDADLSSNVALYDGDMATFSAGTLSDARLSSNVALYDGDMATFSAGTLSDARLSSNVALQDAAGDFSAAQEIAFNDPMPGLTIRDDSANDGGIYLDFIEGSTGTFGVSGLGARIGYESSPNDFVIRMGNAGTVIDALSINRDTGIVNFEQGSGTFTATLTGFSTSTSGTVNYSITNNVATLSAQSGGIIGTSDSTSMGMTGIPTAVRPSQSQCVSSRVRDSGNTWVGETCIANDGTADFALAADVGQNGPIAFVSSGFTASGSKGVSNGWTVTYPLN